ncbi:MAG: GNAT family acetyltransferase, partial [Gammaproteobacteria bacterium]
MTIRPFRAEDTATLVTLWERTGLVRPWNNPVRDIERAVASPAGALFVATEGDDEQIAGSVMVGFEGHRGWIYYLAALPERAGSGLGRELVRHAEQWLQRKGSPKAMLMIREGNPVQAFYAKLGYAVEDRTVMARWLETPPDRPPSARTAQPTGRTPKLEVRVTQLGMRRAPAAPARPAPGPGLRIERVTRPTLAFYRFLYREVGEPCLWWLRRVMPDEELLRIVHHPQVSVNVLYAGGAPAGYAELDAREPGQVEIAYFGLMPQFIGRGLGPYLLDWAIAEAWAASPARVWLHTCNLDHP